MDTVVLKLPKGQEMVSVTRAFCHKIEQVGEEPLFDWLGDITRLLPRIHASIAELGRVSDDLTHSATNNLDERFDLFTRLKNYLGERDGYWMEFDDMDDDLPSGSLADDFTDIYFELKHGLDAYDEDPTSVHHAIDNWRAGFYLHWGQHLVDAERQLYTMCSRRRIMKHLG